MTTKKQLRDCQRELLLYTSRNVLPFVIKPEDKLAAIYIYTDHYFNGENVLELAAICATHGLTKWQVGKSEIDSLFRLSIYKPLAIDGIANLEGGEE